MTDATLRKPRKPAAHYTPREPHEAVYELARFMGLLGVTPTLAGNLLFAPPRRGASHLERLEFNGRVFQPHPGVYVADIYEPLE